MVISEGATYNFPWGEVDSCSKFINPFVSEMNTDVQNNDIMTNLLENSKHNGKLKYKKMLFRGEKHDHSFYKPYSWRWGENAD